MKRRGPRFALQWRVTAALVVIVLIPFALSYVLLDQIGRSAANYKANEARESIAAMDKALDAYRDLFETTKRLHADIADSVRGFGELLVYQALEPKLALFEQSSAKLIAAQRREGHNASPITEQDRKRRHAALHRLHLQHHRGAHAARFHR